MQSLKKFYQNHEQNWILLSKKIASMTHDELSQRGFEGPCSEFLALKLPLTNAPTDFSGLAEELSWSCVVCLLNIDGMYLLSKQGMLQRKYQTIFLLVAAPHASLCESCLFCGNRHIWAPFGSVQPAEEPSRIPLYLMNHPQSASWVLAETTLLEGRGAEQGGNGLILRSQASCSMIRNIMFWLKSRSHLIGVSLRQGKYWTSWCNSTESERW